MKALITLLLLTTSAFAQQVNPVETKVGAIIGQLTISNSALQTQVEQMKAEIDKLKKELADAQQKSSPSQNDGRSGPQSPVR